MSSCDAGFEEKRTEATTQAMRKIQDACLEDMATRKNIDVCQAEPKQGGPEPDNVFGDARYGIAIKNQYIGDMEFPDILSGSLWWTNRVDLTCRDLPMHLG